MTREDALALVRLLTQDRSGVPPLNTLAMARLLVAVVSEQTVRDLNALRARQGLPLD